MTALSNPFNRTEKIYQKFFEKTGIRIKDEPIKTSPSEIDSIMERLYHLPLFLFFPAPQKLSKN